MNVAKSFFFFFSSRRRHTSWPRDWSSDVCSSDLALPWSSMLRIYLGHGASGTAASMKPWVDGLRARGFEAHALDLPKRKAEDAVAAFEAQVPDEPGVVIGGHSFGGRVASLAAAGVGRADGELPRRYAGLVCLSYPV